MASYIRKGFIAMAEKSNYSSRSEGSSNSSKRAVEDDGEPAQSAQKRPFWVTRNDGFVTRRDFMWRGTSGSSGGRGGGGRGRGRGRGWYYWFFIIFCSFIFLMKTSEALL
jgi:hypothetical protein